MTEALGLAVSLGAGQVLGAVFFGGLWWTVRCAVSSRWVLLWFLGSLLLRTAFVLFGLYVVCGADWKRWLAGLLGFVTARIAATRLLPAMRRSAPAVREAGNAP